RVPGDERDAVPFAVVEYGLRLAVGQGVPVLHRDGGEHGARAVDFIDSDVREADVPDQPALLELSERAELLVLWHRGVDAMELIQIDPLELEPLQAAVKR